MSRSCGGFSLASRACSNISAEPQRRPNADERGGLAARAVGRHRLLQRPVAGKQIDVRDRAATG